MAASLYPSLPILLVDDELQVLDGVALALRLNGITNVRKCSDSRDVPQLLAEHSFAVILLDLLMPHCTGQELLPRIKSAAPETTVIVLTAVNEVETAVGCMKAGAYDYLLKPVGKEDLTACIRRAVEFWELRTENDRLRKSLLSETPLDTSPFSGIITRNRSMISLFKYIEAIGPTSMPVLITGETGTGKELMARSVHECSGRTGEFVAVNVAGLDDNLFSDTLFGHIKGAFTGAATPRQGLIAKAAGGTLFLDEMGDLSPESQVKLLRLLEDRSYYPIGSDSPRTTDARVVVATNRTIGDLRADENFRDDLFFRLRTHHVHIPALRERKEDIPLLTEAFLEMAAREMGKDKPTAPSEIDSLLGSYFFPGNVRELRGLVFDAVGRHTGGVLSLETFRQTLLPQPGTHTDTPPLSEHRVSFGDQLPTLREVEEALIEEALERANGNQTVASSYLGITRSALNKRINKRS